MHSFVFNNNVYIFKIFTVNHFTLKITSQAVSSLVHFTVDMYVHYRMGSSKLALLLVLVSCIERCLSSSCVVDSFTVKEDFDPKRVSEFKETRTPKQQGEK